ncbi:TPA: GIY-YIG nuclease family protein [Burkholderia vietnamiensis]|uniref:Bacteriophage T5 Orf172 DNA-binding domain-containing protein n=1 Tax=Pandoraea apista TaxID=93218 RepID=A0A5E5P1L3_9BURK|nr:MULTISPECIES: GIY-YIG nuclease family protein [Burkholderiaceae]MCA8206266.1 GIY-YIG nuclease family protein [Burkholderia vietnamiensis]VVG70468.1 hypothetical protein PAP18089_01428 [Pandoraea apista]HDR8943065.1 GIY-YIG nuclease family protein [Burkholderia vietnamiensis]HDR9121040.1 GIY-YIG nuclease family protein [Burkholderia vietnamiensis]HDR9205316.1 GIY-YIG nuclease family protein [Burkholderia vietnamiensis]
MEGYVYVMSNKAMPGLVKVGFTTGTPEERAAQLNGTHSPHPVVVEYSTHVPDARAVEREAHLRLRKHREGKEWFRCSRELAINAIKRAAGDLARNEFSRVEQERQQAAYQEQARQHREAEKRARDEEQRKAGLRIAVEQRYGPRLAKCFPSFWSVYGWSCVTVWFVIACFPGATFMGGLFGGALLGFILAFVAKGVLDDRAMKSPAYVAAAAERQRELDAIDRSGPPPAPASSTSTPAKPTVSTRATAPAPRLVRGDYTIEPPTGTIAADKSPEQLARERAARVNQDPAA